VEEEPKQPAFELPAEFRAAGNKVMPGDLALPGSYKLTEGADLQCVCAGNTHHAHSRHVATRFNAHIRSTARRFGASKIFLKEPRTLFALEYMR